MLEDCQARKRQAQQATLSLPVSEVACKRYYDDLPTSGSDGGRAFRDLEWEALAEIKAPMGPSILCERRRF